MNKKNCGCFTSKLGWLFVIVGALNWGLVGLGGFFGADWNLVEWIFRVDWLINLVYLLVGVSGVVLLFGGCRCKKCRAARGGGSSSGSNPMMDQGSSHHQQM